MLDDRHKSQPFELGLLSPVRLIQASFLNHHVVATDVILWCTGSRSALHHLAPLRLREPNGGIVMTGSLATQVARDPRIHLVGYGPSASTVGANRAGAAAARELTSFLGL